MNDFILRDLIGTYYVFKYRTNREAHEYTLEILEDHNFKLELAVSGQFGSIGEDWTGIIFAEKDALKLECARHIDWRYTFLDEERQDMPSSLNKIFDVKFSKEGNDIKIVLSLELGDIILYRAFKKISQLTYWITREIIKLYGLDEKVNNSGPGRYWRISNLIVRDYKKTGIQLNKAQCEFDLDIATEEKRVVDAPEFTREHHIDSVIFNEKYKIITYDMFK